MRSTISIGFLLMCLAAGCSVSPDRQERLTRGYVYYLDGAGGAGLVTNWSRGVRQGLIDAGYSGAGEVFVWQTQLGVVADQDASVGYKRSKAAELARRIEGYSEEHPNAPVTIMGLSAGTSIAVFALEALPEDHPVENVVLLSSSVSSDYDLTNALKRVRGHIYVFTSERDSVLRFLVPVAGTADRRSGRVPSAGLRGFRTPQSRLPEVREQYKKLVHIRWRSEFAAAGNLGGHTDVVKPKFVAAYVAPLIKTTERAGVVALSPPVAARCPGPGLGMPLMVPGACVP